MLLQKRKCDNMTLCKCLFSESYTDKEGKLTLPPRCKKKKCKGYDDEEKPVCEYFLPKDFTQIKEDKKIIKKK